MKYGFNLTWNELQKDPQALELLVRMYRSADLYNREDLGQLSGRIRTTCSPKYTSGSSPHSPL